MHIKSQPNPEPYSADCCDIGLAGPCLVLWGFDLIEHVKQLNVEAC